MGRNWNGKIKWGAARKRKTREESQGETLTLRAICGAMQKHNIIETSLHILYRYDGSLNEINI